MRRIHSLWRTLYMKRWGLAMASKIWLMLISIRSNSNTLVGIWEEHPDLNHPVLVLIEEMVALWMAHRNSLLWMDQIMAQLGSVLWIMFRTVCILTHLIICLCNKSQYTFRSLSNLSLIKWPRRWNPWVKDFISSSNTRICVRNASKTLNLSIPYQSYHHTWANTVV